MDKKETCFLIMPFNKEGNAIWEIMKRVGKQFRYLHIERSETDTPTKKGLFQDIKEKISIASFTIADFSEDIRWGKCPNPNVMTEAGFALGLGKHPYIIAKKGKLNIPSDWNQFKFALYEYDSKNPEDFEEWFENYIEMIMIQNNIDTERVVLRRETEAQKLNWLINLVGYLRNKAKNVYQDESGLWSVGKMYFNQDACIFNLFHKLVPSPENVGDSVEIQCGVYFSFWDRTKSPFKIVARWLDQNKKELKRTEDLIELKESIETIPNEKVWQEFEIRLDKLLKQITPSLSTLTPLAKMISTMNIVLDQLKKIEMPGLISKKGTRVMWTTNGCEVPYFLIDNSEITLNIDFQGWEEKGSPYSIYFRPERANDRNDIENWFNDKKFKNLECKFEGSEYVIKIPMSDNNSVKGMISIYQTVLAELIRQYKPVLQPKQVTENDLIVSKVNDINVNIDSTATSLPQNNTAIPQ